MAIQNIDDPIRIRLSLEEYDLAKQHWDSGKGALAGKIIFEKIGAQRRPRWAARILKFAISEHHDSLISYVLEIAADPERWHEGRKAFDQLRKFSRDDESLLFKLAEKTAKVIYNATEPPAPFDWHVGWSLCEDACELAQSSPESDFSKNLWRLIAGDRPEQ